MNLPMGITIPQAALTAIGTFLIFVYPHLEKKKSKNSSLMSKLGWVALVAGAGWIGYEKFGNNRVSSNFTINPNDLFPNPPIISSYAPPVNNLMIASKRFSNQVDKIQPVDKYALIPYTDTERKIPQVLSPFDVPTLGFTNESSSAGSNTIKVI